MKLNENIIVSDNAIEAAESQQNAISAVIEAYAKEHGCVRRPPTDWFNLYDVNNDEAKLFATISRELGHNAKQHNASFMGMFCVNRINSSAKDPLEQYSEYFVCVNDGDCVGTQELSMLALTPSVSIDPNAGTHGQGMKTSAFMIAQPDDAHLIFLSREKRGSNNWVGSELRYINEDAHCIDIKKTELDFWIPYLQKHLAMVNRNFFDDSNVIVLSRYVRGVEMAKFRRKIKSADFDEDPEGKKKNSDRSIITSSRAMLLLLLSPDVVGKKKINVFYSQTSCVFGESTLHLGFDTKGTDEKKHKYLEIPSLKSFYNDFMLNGTLKSFVFRNFNYPDPANHGIVENEEAIVVLGYLPSLLSGGTNGYIINYADHSILQKSKGKGKHGSKYPQYNVWLSGDFKFGRETRVADEPIYFKKDSGGYLRRLGLHWAGTANKTGNNKTKNDFSTIIDQLRRINYPEIFIEDMKPDGYNWQLGNDFMIQIYLKPKKKTAYINSCFLMEPAKAEYIINKLFDHIEDLMEAGNDPVANSLKNYIKEMNTKYAPKRNHTKEMPKIGAAENIDKIDILDVYDSKLPNVKISRFPCDEISQSFTVFLKDKEGKFVNNTILESYRKDDENGLRISDGGLDKNKNRMYNIQISAMQLFDGADFNAVPKEEFAQNLLTSKADGRKKYRPWKNAYIKIGGIPYKLSAYIDIGKTLAKKRKDPENGIADDNPEENEAKESMGNPWQEMSENILGEYNLRKKKLTLNEDHSLFIGLHGYRPHDKNQKAIEGAYFSVKRQLDTIFSDGLLIDVSTKQGAIFDGRTLADLLIEKFLEGAFANPIMKKIIHGMVESLK